MMSPGAQQFQNAMIGSAQGNGGAEAILEKTFSSMAYSALEQRAPDLMPSVVTFRVLQADMETGHAVGAFVVSRRRSISYVPVVLSENKIKPIEIIFSKDMGMFLPLTPKWLSEMEKLEDQPMGAPAEIPETVDQDVGLQHMLAPPSLGRFGYASEILSEMLDTPSEKTASDRADALNEILEKAGPDFGEALMASMMGTPKMAEAYLNILDGPENVARYFCRAVKEAQEPAPKIPEFQLVLAGESPARFREVFGEKAASAYQSALEMGYAIKEDPNRETRNAVKIAALRDDETPGMKGEKFTKGTQRTEYPFTLDCPMRTGFYRVYDSKGGTHEVFAMPSSDEYRNWGHRHTDIGVNHIIVFSDGSYLRANDISGTPLNPEEARNTAVYKRLKKNFSAGQIVRGCGVFVRLDREDRHDCVGPVHIEKVYTGQKETRAETWNRKSYVVRDTDKGGKMCLGDTLFLSKKYQYVPLGDRKDICLLKTPQEIEKAILSGLHKAAASTVKVSYDKHEKLFHVDRRPCNRAQGVSFLAMQHKLSAECSERIMDACMSASEPLTFVTLTDVGMSKIASIFGEDQQAAQAQAPMDPAMQQAAMQQMAMQGGGGMPMDPAMMQQMGMDPAMMQQMAMQGGGGMPMDPSMMGMDPSMMGGGGMSGMALGDELEVPAINPAFADDPSLLQDPSLMDMTTLDVIIRSPTLKDIVKDYSEVILKSLDHLGRILLAIYIKEPTLKDEVGNVQFSALENGVRNLFKSMGETLLDLHQNTAILSHSMSNFIADNQSEHATKSNM